MLSININTSEELVSKVYDQDGLGQNVVGKVHRLPLCYRLEQYKRIAVWVTNLQTFKSNFHYVTVQDSNRLASIDGQIEVFAGIADISIDNFLIRSPKNEPKNHKKFPVRGNQQLPLDVIKGTLN